MADLQRALTATEQREAQTIFGARINYASVKVVRGRYIFFQPDNVAMAPNGNVYFPPTIYRPDFSINPDAMSFLIHELTHVWQIQSGVWLKFRRVIIEGGDYDYALDASRTLASYKVEEQAAIVADYYRILHNLGTLHGRGSFEIYSRMVRTAMRG